MPSEDRTDRFDSISSIQLFREVQQTCRFFTHESVSSHREESAFAFELHAALDQLSLMSRSGMYIGAHGQDHYWLDRLSPEQQRSELSGTIAFSADVDAPVGRWIMCYPYGRHNDSLRAVLPKSGCVATLTTWLDIALAGEDDPLALPRLDTNGLPKSC